MRIYRRGGRLRWRRRAAKVASMTLSLAMVSSAMAFALTAKPHAPKPKENHVATEPTHTPKPSHEPVHSEGPAPTPSHSGTPKAEPTTSSSPTSEPSHEPTPEPTQSQDCHDSYDPACGEFFWDPSPGENAPMTGSLTWVPEHPAFGQDVTFTFIVDDPDAPIGTDKIFARYGDGPGGGEGNPTGCSGRYGPWTPPAKKHGHRELTFHHTYTEAGEYHPSFLAISAGNACYQPYLSRREVNETIVVQSPEPSPSPT